MKLSVVMPAYNEEKDIKEAVLDIMKNLPDAEIIVVNDASKDSTLSILKSIMRTNMTIITNEVNRGHGYSVITGLKHAKGDYILYIDADRQIKLEEYLFYEDLGYMRINDFVSGWRIGRQDKIFRKINSFLLKMIILFRHGYYIKDANCPFKVYRRDKLLPLLELLPKTYIIPIACLEVLARKKGLKTFTIMTPHMPYEGERKGFLQILNISTLKFFGKAFLEIIRL